MRALVFSDGCLQLLPDDSHCREQLWAALACDSGVADVLFEQMFQLAACVVEVCFWTLHDVVTDVLLHLAFCVGITLPDSGRFERK